MCLYIHWMLDECNTTQACISVDEFARRRPLQDGVATKTSNLRVRMCRWLTKRPGGGRQLVSRVEICPLKYGSRSRTETIVWPHFGPCAPAFSSGRRRSFVLQKMPWLRGGAQRQRGQQVSRSRFPAAGFSVRRAARSEFPLPASLPRRREPTRQSC